jgi:hypothetical protein
MERLGRAPDRASGGTRLAWTCALLLATLALAGCGSGSSDGDTNVVYSVLSTECTADIIYENTALTQTTLLGQTLPWNTGFTIPASKVNGYPLFLQATSDCAFPAPLTANIVVNGALFATQTDFAASGVVVLSESLF